MLLNQACMMPLTWSRPECTVIPGRSHEIPAFTLAVGSTNKTCRPFDAPCPDSFPALLPKPLPHASMSVFHHTVRGKLYDLHLQMQVWITDSKLKCPTWHIRNFCLRFSIVTAFSVVWDLFLMCLYHQGLILTVLARMRTHGHHTQAG